MSSKIPEREPQYLIDSNGEFVTIDPIKTEYSRLTIAGYKVLDLTYNRNMFIEKKNLEELDPIAETAKLSYSKEDNFGVYYSYYYHITLDIYLLITGSSTNRYFEEEDVVQNSDFLRVSHIFYKENLQDVQKYLNETLVNKMSSKNKIDIIIQTQTGFEFKEHTINPLKIDIDTMYNNDFVPIHEHIVDKLNLGKKGIILLYGTAGCGKTNYLMSLTQMVDKKFVFLLANMIGHVSSPSFIGDLIDNKGGVLVIEDCEQYIQDRATSQDSIVSALLQITDGILSDILDIQIICTFNTDLTRVDPALRREGRLIAEYEFTELTDEKAEALAGEAFEGPKTLANIFNKLTYKKNRKEEKTIGFGR